MTGAIMFCDEAPEVTERSGMFVIEIGSGSERVSYAMTQKAVSILAERSMQAVAALVQRRHDAVVPFPAANPTKRQKTKTASTRGKGR